MNGDTKTLESTIVTAVRSLLLLGGINESKLEDPILDFLHRIPLRGDHVDTATCDALTMFLKMNPHRLRDFIRRSSSEAHTKQHMVNMRILPANYHRNSIMLSEDGRDLVHRESRLAYQSYQAKISGLYARATCTNFGHGGSGSGSGGDAAVGSVGVGYAGWVQLHRIHPSSILAFCLLHMCSPALEIRVAALELAAAIAKPSPASANQRVVGGGGAAGAGGAGVIDHFDPGYTIRPVSPTSPFMYTRAALKYSTSLAVIPAHHTAIPALLVEVCRFMEFISDRNKEAFLRLLVPWIAQFGVVLASLSTEKERKVRTWAILSILLTLTRQCSLSSILLGVLDSLWAALLADTHHSMCSTVYTHVAASFECVTDATVLCDMVL